MSNEIRQNHKRRGSLQPRYVAIIAQAIWPAFVPAPHLDEPK